MCNIFIYKVICKITMIKSKIQLISFTNSRAICVLPMLKNDSLKNNTIGVKHKSIKPIEKNNIPKLTKSFLFLCLTIRYVLLCFFLMNILVPPKNNNNAA